MQQATSLTRSLSVVASLAFAAQAHATTLEVQEAQLTFSSAWETYPTIGNDGISDLVVYTSRVRNLNGTYQAGDIYAQRVVDGVPFGAAIPITGASVGDPPEIDDRLNDVSGDYIVFTAYQSATSTGGTIVLHQISTGARHNLASPIQVQEPRIHGTRIVWREGTAGATVIKLYDLAWGLGASAITISGPNPPVTAIDIGEEYAVWSELDNLQYDVFAYELATGTKTRLTNTPTENELLASTSGSWIVWNTTMSGVTAARIEGIDLAAASPQVEVLISDGARNVRPTIVGDVIAYESNAAGNFDIYLYRMVEKDIFQVTTDPADQYLNDIYGDLVAYVDQRSGNEDVFVASIAFVEPDPCAGLGGDADGDGVCDDADNCPGLANPEQGACDCQGGDADGDSVCDDGDNCPGLANPGQGACDCSTSPECTGGDDTFCPADSGEPACGSCLSIRLEAEKVRGPSEARHARTCTCRPLSFHVPSEIPVTDGNAGNHLAFLQYHDPDTDEVVMCHYRGGADEARPSCSEEIAKGLRYVFSSCSNGLQAGDIGRANYFHLWIANGDPRLERTAVELELDEVGGQCDGLEAESDTGDNAIFADLHASRLPASRAEGCSSTATGAEAALALLAMLGMRGLRRKRD